MTTAQVEMRHKSKLRIHGWAGETSDVEATYIQGWLQSRADGGDEAVLRLYATADGYVLHSHARMYARGE